MNRIIYIIIPLCILLTYNGCSNHTNFYSIGDIETSYSLSSEDVTDFAMDTNGYMWIGTSDGLNLFDGHRYRQFFNNENDTNSLINNQINKLFSDRKKNIWIGTKNGICLYKGNGEFKSIPVENSQLSDVTQIQESSNGNIAICVNGDLYAYDSLKQMFVHKFQVTELEKFSFFFYPDNKNGFLLISPEHIRHLNKLFEEDKVVANMPNSNMVFTTISNNAIWIASRVGGIKKIDIATDSIITLKNALPILPNYLIVYKDNLLINSKSGLYNFDIQKNSLSHINDLELALNFNHLQVSCWYLDANENLWIGLSNGGYLYLNPSINQINEFKKSKLCLQTRDQSVISLTTDENQNIWGALADNRLFYFNKQKNEIKFFQLESLFFDFYLHRIRKILTYKDKVIISTESRIIICHFNNDQLVTGKSIRLGILKTRIEDFIPDQFGNLIISTNRKSVIVAHIDNDKMETYPIITPSYNTNSRLYLLSTGEILIFMQGFHFKLYNPNEKTLHELPINLSDFDKKNVPTTIFEDSQKRIWLGTNNGLYELDIKNKKIIPVENGNHLTINSIQEDKKNHFWIGTNRGLIEFFPEKNESYSFSTEIIPKEKPEIYNNRSSCVFNDSIFVFGHTKGSTIFTPSLMTEIQPPKLYIEKVNVRKENKILGVDFLYNTANTQDIHLKYNENNLEISFASINYNFSPQYFYFYKLEGFDNQWIRSRSVGNISYSNLPHGEYIFKVKLAYSPNADSFLEKQIKISIARAPWFSIPAILLYALLILVIIFYILQLYIRIRTEHIAATMAQRDKEREQWASQMNMNFFANISHEFRNPLTMIAGPISTMSHDKDLPKHTQHLLNIVSRSVQQMLKLINQMLNFNKLESDVLKMQIGWYDIVYETNTLIEQFEICTNEKNIQIKRIGLGSPYFTILDREKLNEIIGNLFSNALKHTPQNGIIQIQFKVIRKEEVLTSFGNTSSNSNEYIYISVEDNGPGIPENLQEDIFRRYYQITDSINIKYENWGTGIGLYYVKKLVELHHGLIKVKNSTEGGATFYFVLPIEQSSYNSDEWVAKTTSVSDAHFKSISFQTFDYEETTPANLDLPNLLIVEDDTEVSYYLRTIFNREFNVINKYNAESALESLQNIAPDIILSDVVMDEMSGYDFCKTIKNDRAFCHIPVILLTAKSQIEEQIAGLEIGANAYVTKPFDPLYLKALIQSQLKNRNYIRDLLNNAERKEEVVDSLSPQDSTFIKELYEIMDKMIADDDLNLTTVSEQLHMSRAKFNYKMKGLTGETPNVFFKKYKLNKAAKLLKEGKYNVSEVAYMTGFGTIAHFSVSFKKQFGVNPSEYK